MNSTTATAAKATPWSAIQACTDGSPDAVTVAIAAAPTGFALPARCSRTAATSSASEPFVDSARSIVSACSTICRRASAAFAASTVNSGAGSNPRCRTTSRSQALGMTQVSSSATGTGTGFSATATTGAAGATGVTGAAVDPAGR